MIPFFNIKGYDAHDPLDDAPGKLRYIIGIITSALVTLGFLHFIFFEFEVANIPHNWYYFAECALLALIYFPIVIWLRKSSSLVLMGLLMVSMIPIDIFLEAHYRAASLEALWTYNPEGLLGGLPPLGQILSAWIIDSFVFGPFTLWITRLIASLFFKENEKSKQRRSLYDKVFTKERIFESVEKPKFDLSYWILRLLGTAYLAYLLILIIGLLGTAAFPEQLRQMMEMTYENPPLAINTFIKITIMTVLAFIGAYNVHLRFHTSLALMFGHAISTVFSLFFYYYNTPSTGPVEEYRDFLMTSAIVDGVMIIGFLWIMFKHKDKAKQLKDNDEYPMFFSLPNRITQTFYYIFGSALGLIVLLVLGARLFLDGSAGWGAVYGFPDSQICNTITKYATFSFLAFLIASREPLRQHLYKVFLLGYSLSVISSGLWLLIGGMASGPIEVNTRLGTITSVDWYFMVNVIIDGFVVILILSLRKMYYDVDYSIKALSPSNAQNVIAVHDAVYGGEAEELSDVLVNIDNHVGGTRGRKRGLLNFPFWVIENITNLVYALHPSFSSMDRENRRYFLRKYIFRPPNERRKSYIPFLAEFFYKIGTGVHALVTMAHYNNLKAKERIGFIPVDARDRLQGDYPKFSPPFKHAAQLPDSHTHPANFEEKEADDSKPLVAPRVVTPIKEDSIPEEVDYVVVGSGAGGAVAAYRLACQVEDPSKILLVERGPRYSPLQDFNDNELEMVRKLYKEGGIQQTKRFDMTVFQGECLGGTTVINNAICFEMPEFMRNKWKEEFDLDLSKIDEEYAQIAEEIDIKPLSNNAINQRVLEKFLNGVRGYNSNVDENSKLNEEQLKANVRNELGDGADNLGNKRMRKRSMLETYIPWAEARGVKIVCNTSAVKINYEGSKAKSILLGTNIGTYKNVKVNKGILVGCGTIASSHLLMRSGIKENVGQRMSCNFAFPVAFQFPDELDAFDGSQITFGAIEKNNRAVFETYFNPPAAFATSIPFYFNKLESTMNKYRSMVNFGALVGSESNGTIELKTDWVNGRAFKWNLGEYDKENIKYAFKTLLNIGKEAGAEKCVLPLEPGVSINLNDNDIDDFIENFDNYPLSMKDLLLTTAHPQGGNMMAGDNSMHKSNRVVDKNFKVDGFDNVYVVDASIFPSGITVNPQWTIMALSSMAAKGVE